MQALLQIINLEVFTMHKANFTIDNKMYNTLVNLKEALANSAEGAKSQASDMLSDLIEDMDDVRSEAQGYAEQYVKSYPLKSIGIAVAAGIFLGKFIL
jgi:ElaB/YqjD/DUF883 family membrane-anchored ribosome-binding protein